MDIKTLAQEYIREYKATPELANWDHVIELGKRLADAVLSGAKSEQPLPKRAVTNYIGGLTKKEKELIETNNFLPAVKAVRVRLGCGLIEAKHLCDDYRAFLGTLMGKPKHRADCGGCLECSPVPWKKP